MVPADGWDARYADWWLLWLLQSHLVVLCAGSEESTSGPTKVFEFPGLREGCSGKEFWI